MKKPVLGPVDGVIVTPKRQISDERGRVMHMLRADEEIFRKFGEIYFSWIYPGVVKAWHWHELMGLNYAVPVGRIKLVIFDDRKGSRTRGHLMEICTGEDSYALVTVPAQVWNGFTAIGAGPAMVANCATTPHDPTKIRRKDPFSRDIPYDWGVR